MRHDYCIKSENILLRPITAQDIEMTRLWRNRDEIRKCFLFDKIISAEQQINWFDKYLNQCNDLMFIIEEVAQLKSSIGTVALYNINKHTSDAEFGRLIIGEVNASGRGLALKATKAICEFAFNTLGMDRIYLEVFKDNIKAKNLYEKAGFYCESERVYEGRELIKMILNH
jgi:diamine N-acetyltransferase